MSNHAAAAHGQGHDASHGTVKSYLIGFMLSLVLTGLSFGLVMSGIWPRHIAIPALIGLCVVQLLVQLVYFLHLGTSKSQRENVTTFVFTLLIIFIIVGGSAWVLHNMNANMMPNM